MVLYGSDGEKAVIVINSIAYFDIRGAKDLILHVLTIVILFIMLLEG